MASTANHCTVSLWQYWSWAYMTGPSNFFLSTCWGWVILVCVVALWLLVLTLPVIAWLLFACCTLPFTDKMLRSALGKVPSSYLLRSEKLLPVATRCYFPALKQCCFPRSSSSYFSIAFVEIRLIFSASNLFLTALQATRVTASVDRWQEFHLRLYLVAR